MAKEADLPKPSMVLSLSGRVLSRGGRSASFHLVEAWGGRLMLSKPKSIYLWRIRRALGDEQATDRGPLNVVRLGYSGVKLSGLRRVPAVAGQRRMENAMIQLNLANGDFQPLGLRGKLADVDLKASIMLNWKAGTFVKSRYSILKQMRYNHQGGRIVQYSGAANRVAIQIGGVSSTDVFLS
ncbi:hypothetical protein E4U41_002550 [Claviceps citrina]|nr:hypothetical protein E4U41_002550 [Claviceps citrina]